MKSQIKTLFSLAIFMLLTACGSSDESSIDLSPFKGLDAADQGVRSRGQSRMPLS